MAIYTPYFYIIQDIRNGIFYAGAKWGRGANPASFMIEGGYTTSSKIINQLIHEYGLDSFSIRKVKVFNTAKEASDYESKFLRKVDARNNTRFYNCHNNDGVGFTDPIFRKMVGEDGLTSFQRGGKKAAETKRNTIIDGKNLFQIAYTKALKNNPNLKEVRRQRRIESMREVNPETGLNRYQMAGKKIAGENNPSKNPINAKRISEGIKNFYKENPDKKEEFQKKAKEALAAKDELGLSAHDYHSIWMLENNPTRGSKWFNNGKVNKRIKDGDQIPDGFVEGRLPMKKSPPIDDC